jgi:hypothetical protein
MSRFTALLILAVCALLEAGGDALVRKGMHAGTLAGRAALYLCAAAVLFAYGWLVNRPPWTFGSLLGIYVALFFVVAQVVGIVFFGDKLTAPIVAGGALIVTGGLVITLWH